MPFSEAAAAASGGGVLGLKDGVALKGGLFTVVGGKGGGEALADKIVGMVFNFFKA